MSDEGRLDPVPEYGPNDPESWRGYCLTIAGRILDNDQDAEDCVSEVMLKAWETIPKYAPENLKTFLGKLTRNTAINMRVRSRAQRRDSAKTTPLSELSELVSGTDDPEQTLIRKELIGAINDFLSTLPENRRDLFVLRYWHFESVENLASKFGVSEKISYVQLHRLRKRLKKYLKEKEYLL